ncbi:MAG: KpsF/GutQ family sugar-phosphate isomerase [Verrucomicrobiae bacterium]|nr:KpsF/GutQ family sugar-phosphate isomerase [Verrucomicrobiae bacterium]
MDGLAKAREVLDIEIEGLETLRARLGPEVVRAIDLLKDSLDRGHKIIATGIGKSGHVAEKVAATFTSTGAPCVYLNCVNAIHGDLGLVSEGDCILIFSYSGETDEIVRTLPALRRPGVHVIGLTADPASTLAQNADVHLDVRVEREACPHNLAPTASTTAMMALGDALAMVLLQARGFRREDFAQLHPGGAIGRHLLLAVRDVMRTGDRVATVRADQTVLDAVNAMNRARSGAAVILDDGGILLGIFTQGDFVRHYQSDEQLGRRPVSGVMTHNPIVVRDDRLAVEAVRIFEKHQIDDLVVIDEKRRLLGVVDAQDLARFRLI